MASAGIHGVGCVRLQKSYNEGWPREGITPHVIPKMKYKQRVSFRKNIELAGREGQYRIWIPQRQKQKIKEMS